MIESVPPLFGSLRERGEQVAIVTATATVTYRDLAERVDAATLALGPTRRLVALDGQNSVESLVWLLACLAGTHPVLMADTESLPALVSAYDPDVVITDSLQERRPGSRHALHRDLALLLSTSGSTGSAKTVRLSRDNLAANAAAIAQYLGLTPADRALTTLPLHYCYGLSVVTSHLSAGASLALTDWSVVDECLWQFAADARVTSFAGVPYTFEMLDVGRFAAQAPPSLRYVTQAGGRLDPDVVRHWARLGRDCGWDFVVMYGQTEATARMAYLPPSLTETHPHALGVPIPGGELRLDPVGGEPAGIGEIVYRGANVMLGYAEGPADLARGAELAELRTGDLGMIDDDGLFVWVGRRNRVAKCFGLRIDLDHVERMLAAEGLAARCVQDGNGVHVFVGRSEQTAHAHELAEHHTRLPSHAIGVSAVARLPRTTSGKIDYRALAELATPQTDSRSGLTVQQLYATVLNRPLAGEDDSFVSLGGDSLSYVELSVRLGERGIDLPADWHRRAIGELEQAPATGKHGVTIDTSVLLRALAIVLVVGTHSDVFTLPGGAHLLLAVAGYNFARFAAGHGRVRQVLSSVARIAIPSALCIGGIGLLTGTYQWPTALMLNAVLGEDHWTRQWQFWFLEAIVWFQLIAVGVTAVPRVARLLQRHPFAAVSTATVAAIGLRYALVGVQADIPERYSPPVVAWCFLVGWTVAVATTARQRAVAALLAAAGTIGFFGEPLREAIVIAGIGALLLWPTVRVPRPLARTAGVLATASLFIYLTHWQVYPHLEDTRPVLGLLASLAVGVAVQRAWDGIGLGRLSGWGAPARDRAPAPRPRYPRPERVTPDREPTLRHRRAA